MYERENARRLIIIGIGIVAAVVIIGLFFLLRGSGSSNNTAAPAVPTTAQVVVALQPIPQDTSLTAAQVPQYFGVSTVPYTIAPAGAYTTVDQLRAVVNGAPTHQITAAQTVFQKSIIVPGMFTTLGQFRTAPGASFVIPYGYVGMSISFDPINSVLNSINAGDDIDIIASFKGSASAGVSAKTPPQTQYVVTGLRVLSVNAPPVPQANQSGVQSTSPGTSGATPVTVAPAPAPTAAPAGGGTLVVMARYQQALELQHLKDFGWQISAVLRSAKQQTIPHLKTLPVTDRWFFVKTQTPFKQSPGY